MSEQLRHTGEQGAESIDASAESQKNLERLQEAAEQAEKDPLQKHVESLKQSAESQAISGKEFNVGDKQGESSSQTFGVHKQLKNDAYKRTIHKVQSKLHAPERVLSRVIHQPAVDAASNVAAKTVARPSGFLGGSLVAFIGSAVFLYMARQYGFSYNYAVVFMLFVGGFFLGLILELFIRLIFRSKASE
jgi:hypothetical protein